MGKGVILGILAVVQCWLSMQYSFNKKSFKATGTLKLKKCNSSLPVTYKWIRIPPADQRNLVKLGEGSGYHSGLSLNVARVDPHLWLWDAKFFRCELERDLDFTSHEDTVKPRTVTAGGDTEYCETSQGLSVLMFHLSPQPSDTLVSNTS